MDSGNSGSIQSSSGGDDEEYDSRPQSIPPFFNPLPPPPHTHFGVSASDSNPEQPHINNSLFSHHHHFQNNQQSSGLFDLSSNYFQALSQSHPPNFFLNHDSVVHQRSDDIHPIPTSSIQLGNPPGPGPGPSVLLNINEAQPGPRPVQSNNNNNGSGSGGGGGGGRNSKKRSRASRRAPTTVLTTDTSNFRAMVQEFTGIPAAPPFSVASSYSRRFDLFGGGGGGGSSSSGGGLIRDNTTLGPLYPHLHRPSPQKLHQSSPLLLSTSHNEESAANVAATNNYHHHHHHHVLEMQNPNSAPIFQIQSALNDDHVPAGFGMGRPAPPHPPQRTDQLHHMVMAEEEENGIRHELFRALHGNSHQLTASCKFNSSLVSPAPAATSSRATEPALDSWISPNSD